MVSLESSGIATTILRTQASGKVSVIVAAERPDQSICKSIVDHYSTADIFIRKFDFVGKGLKTLTIHL